MTLAEQIALVFRIATRTLKRSAAAGSKRPFLELRALWVISDRGIDTQVGLADRLLIDAPAASRLIDRLEKEGLVRRGEGPDRRTGSIGVTAKARPHVIAMRQAMQALEVELGSHLSKAERQALRVMLEKLVDGMSAERTVRRSARGRPQSA